MSKPALHDHVRDLHKKIDELASTIALDRPASPRVQPVYRSSTHMILIAPGATLSQEAVGHLLSAASETLADIVFGDERAVTATGSFLGHRRLGPFSHETFLGMPDLGCAVAARLDLLRLAGLPEQAVLTGTVLLRLMAHAHTVGHVPTVVGTRRMDDIRVARPSPEDMRLYIAGFDRPAELVGSADGTFDVRYEVGSWKVARVVVGEEPSQTSPSKPRDDPDPPYSGLFRARCGDQVFEAASYGAAVNAAVRGAPDDCDLILIVQQDAFFRSSAGLDRLAESALRDGVGVVAPLILYKDDRIRHAGISLGVGGAWTYVARFDPARSSRRAVGSEPLHGLRPVLAAARHCMALRRTIFDNLTGFDEVLEADAADLDICLRLAETNLSVLIDGRVEMTGAPAVPRWGRSLSRQALSTLRERYGALIDAGDPNWSPNHGDVEATMRTRAIPPLSAR